MDLVLEQSKDGKIIISIEGIKPITMEIPSKILITQVKRWQKKGYKATQ